MSERVTTEDLNVGDLLTDAPKGCRIVSIEEQPGPLLVTWDDGECGIYQRDDPWQRNTDEEDGTAMTDSRSSSVATGLESADFSGCETVTLTRDEIIAQRQAILDRYGLAENDMTAADCGCCPDRNYIPWVAFHGWRTLNWLLGEDR